MVKAKELFGFCMAEVGAYIWTTTNCVLPKNGGKFINNLGFKLYSNGLHLSEIQRHNFKIETGGLSPSILKFFW